ncbi:quinone-dependent dihydroorotate dehydrogenase [Halalkalibaculum roseum]|uniref:quinone-dependent dihydroorotate dehydrogenase n=1 Tax=Halalkalibaculum roseum TaxID=2709311 RepID=UPI002013458E|nr:quinone-dependent dihydroorotate dehydrogenase [Halalkalibaculum roseum]
MIYKSLVRQLLFNFDAEKAHDITYRFAEIASGSSILKSIAKALYSYQSPKLSQQVWGLNFRNPVGLAAGFDKNGKIPAIMEAIGMGYVEVGSITANSSTGNPKPRCFRLPKDQALINRMGLNNDGAKTIVKRLQNKSISFPLGINIAKTHDPQIMGDEAIRDYIFSFKEAKEVADYITINISCPNTTEGKTFEDPAALTELLDALKLRDDASIVPSLIKFSPDLSKDNLLELLEICENHRVHGYVVSNTSSDRSSLKTEYKKLKKIGKGGLSGPPLASKSTERIRWISNATKGQKPIIGVGGINSVEVALDMIRAGADLLQIYTGLVYEGPGLVKKINKGLVDYMDRHGLESIHQIPKE